MAEARVPVRPVDRHSDAESEAEELVLGQEALDALLEIGIPLPDGRLVAVDALMAAIAAGDTTVPATDGEGVPIVVALDMLEKAFVKTGGESEADPPSEEEGQASFRDGMNLLMLGSLLENGRVSASEEPSRPQGITRRGKEKTVDKDEDLRDILVDGPGANDDVIHPGSRPLDGEFMERVRINGDKASFETTQGTGFLLLNDEAGANGYGSIVSVEYNGTIYKASGGQIVIDEPGVWRLTISLAGEPGQPETGYGLYHFEQYGAYDHSKSLDGDTQTFAMTYTIVDSDGLKDNATITFKITDSNPDAVNDSILTLQDDVSVGHVTTNDDGGADLPVGILEIGYRGDSISADQADADGRVTIEGAYGSLVFDFDDGYYEYHSKANVIPEGVDEVIEEFEYTLADSDGDSDSATLQFTILPDDTLPSQPDISNPGAEGEEPKAQSYSWSAISEIDENRDGTVDQVITIKELDPKEDRLDIDGLLAELGHDVLETADDVFRLFDADDSVHLQVDLGAGWQTFAIILNNPPLTSVEVEAAIVD